jgi:hypothetical protein
MEWSRLHQWAGSSCDCSVSVSAADSGSLLLPDAWYEGEFEAVRVALVKVGASNRPALLKRSERRQGTCLA